MDNTVVVTGMGAVTPLGVGAEVLYKRWCAGDFGIADGAGRCTGFDPGEYLSRRELRITDRFTQLSVVAADEALAQAEWHRGDLPYPADRIGCVIASSMGGLDTLLRQFERHLTSMRVSPFTVVMYMPNAAAGVIADRWGFRGESSSVVAACASGTMVLGAAMRMLADDSADAVVVGGADAATFPEALRIFSVMGALSASGVPRPFDRARDGFVLGEGAGALVLERASAARRRGAEVLGEVIGFGASTDAYDMTAPDPSGAAAAAAISRALRTAGVTPAELSMSTRTAPGHSTTTSPKPGHSRPRSASTPTTSRCPRRSPPSDT
jgi:3-oxoacyl-[acyl-carrier-protein] synthase II